MSGLHRNKLPSNGEQLNMLTAINAVLAANDDPWLIKARDLVASTKTRGNCHDCLHRNAYGNEYCEHFNVEIPSDWINQGCDEWEDNIPF